MFRRYRPRFIQRSFYHGSLFPYHPKEGQIRAVCRNVLFRAGFLKGLLAAVVVLSAAGAWQPGWARTNAGSVAASEGPAPPCVGPDSAAPEVRRIVSLVPAITETLFAIGAGGRVVAVSRFCDFPPAIGALPKVGSFLTPSVEAVVALAPDLVLISPSPGNRNAVEAMRRAAVPVEVVDEGSESLAAVEASIKRVGELVSRAEEAARLIAEIEAAVAELRSRVAGLDSPTVAFVVGFEPLILAGPASYLGEMVTVAGGRNIAAELGGKWPRASVEFLLASAPEVIIDATVGMGDEAAAQSEAALAARWRRFSLLPAVVGGKLYAADGGAFLRPGPRLAHALRILAGWIHPEVWPQR